MKIYNTMTRTKEDLVPLVPGEVRIYVCGVTPYDHGHIGHAYSSLVFDVVRRYLVFKGYRVTFVKNFTDIDDKIIRRANSEGVSAREVADRYVASFREDMAAIGVLPGDVEPRATEHVPEMVRLIERLIAGGYAYVVDGDVYFEVRRVPDYGKLSGKNLEDLRAGARVEIDERKRDPRDFALWKSAKPGEPAWDTPWGSGRPGWHVECSAMSSRYLGETLDIHGGGEDLIFPHHECEIAQSEAVTGRPFARLWMHNGLLNLGAEKMSKSLGNVLGIREIARRHRPDALRLNFLGTHYRSPLDWSEDRVRDSARALERFTRLIDDARALDTAAVPAPTESLLGFRARFEAAMDDDFNTPQALAVLFDLTHALQAPRERAHADGSARDVFLAGVAELRTLGAALGLFGAGAAEAAAGPPPEVQRLVEERGQARAQRDFERADTIREAILDLGWAVEDTPAGPRVTRRPA
jgi:cysteinyl-tRNA synthetase